MTTALLVIDMQNFFAPMVRPSLPHVQTLITTFKSSCSPMIITQHGHSKEELTPPYSNQLVRKWGVSGSIATGSSEWKLIPAIEKTTRGCEVIGKNTYDAFIGTALEAMLRERGVERVVVCGVMTDCCCDTTARGAFNRGFETWLVSDACGSANKTQHLAGMKGFGFAFGEVMETAEVVEALEREWGSR